MEIEIHGMHDSNLFRNVLPSFYTVVLGVVNRYLRHLWIIRRDFTMCFLVFKKAASCFNKNKLITIVLVWNDDYIRQLLSNKVVPVFLPSLPFHESTSASTPTLSPFMNLVVSSYLTPALWAKPDLISLPMSKPIIKDANIMQICYTSLSAL